MRPRRKRRYRYDRPVKWHTVRRLFALSVGVLSLHAAAIQDDRQSSLVVTDVTVIPVSMLADRLEHVTVVI